MWEKVFLEEVSKETQSLPFESSCWNSLECPRTLHTTKRLAQHFGRVMNNQYKQSCADLPRVLWLRQTKPNQPHRTLWIYIVFPPGHYDWIPEYLGVARGSFWSFLRSLCYEQVLVSSGVGRTGCWHEYKSLRKRGINFISKPIDKWDHRCAGQIFNFNFVCIAVVQKSWNGQKKG